MVKKKGLKKFNISNKLAYTLMVILSIALLGISVVAYNMPPPTNVGHTLNELAVPTGCVNGQVIKLASGVWTCAVDDETDSRFTINTNGQLCYNNPYSGCGLITGACALVDLWIPVSTGSCLSMTQTSMRTLCASTCPVYACNGDTTTCSGGTSDSLIIDVNCEDDGSTVLCHCFGGGGTYQQEVVIPPGQRCI